MTKDELIATLKEYVTAPVLDAVGEEKPQQDEKKKNPADAKSAEGGAVLGSSVAQAPTHPAAAPALTDAGIPISDEKLIADALEIAHDLAIEQQAEYAARYEGYKPDRHAAAARDVATAKAALAAWQARGQQQAGVPEAVKIAGAKMANTLFNFAQDENMIPNVRLRESCRSMQKEWDATVRAPSVPGEAR